MRTMRRIRNVAFLGLLLTLIWARPVDLRAHDGGFYCGYGYCTLTYDDCFGTWTRWDYRGMGLQYPGECILRYEPAVGGEGTCYINYEDEGPFEWYEPAPVPCTGGRCFVCYQL
jgi:hypothetical protein